MKKLAIFGLAVIIGLSVGIAINRAVSRHNARLLDVYTICTAQRTGHWVSPMRTCAQIEADNNAEYLCRGDNCWVEVK